MRTLTHHNAITILVDYNKDGEALRCTYINQGKASTYINKLERHNIATVLLKNLEDNEQEVSYQPTERMPEAPVESEIVCFITRIVPMNNSKPCLTKEEAERIAKDHSLRAKELYESGMLGLFQMNYKETY